MTEQHKGMAAMLLCALLWSIGGIFIKLLPWNAFVIAGMRSAIAALVVAGYMGLRRIPLVLNRRTVTIAAFLAATYSMFVLSNKLTTAANAIVLQYCAPVFVLLYAAAVKHQKFHLADYLVVAATFLGIAVCFLTQLGGGGTAGNIVAVLTGVSFAGIFIFSEGIPPETRINGILQGQIMTALIGLPLMAFYPPEMSGQALRSILVLGVFQLGIPFVLYAYALERAKPLVCSLLAVLEPLFNPVWVMLFYGEKPGLLSLIGGALVVGAITCWCVYNERRALHEAPVKALKTPTGSAK